MLVLPPPCPQPQLLSSLQAMEAPASRTAGSPEPGPSSSAGAPQTASPLRSNHYLLIDTQGVPYTVLVDEETQRGAGAEGAGAQKKCYSCPVCSRVFEYMSYLQRHSITHSEVKPFECDTCGKAFKRASHLTRHHSIHREGGGRPYSCPVCPRRFREAGELAQHSRVHSGERPFQCPHCPRRFMEQNTLQKHTRWKHSPARRVSTAHPGVGTPLQSRVRSSGDRNLETLPGPGARETHKGPSRKCGPSLSRRRRASPAGTGGEGGAGPFVPGRGATALPAAPAEGGPDPLPRRPALPARAAGWALPACRDTLQTLPSAGHGRHRLRSPGRNPRARVGERGGSPLGPSGPGTAGGEGGRVCAPRPREDPCPRRSPPTRGTKGGGGGRIPTRVPASRSAHAPGLAAAGEGPCASTRGAWDGGGRTQGQTSTLSLQVGVHLPPRSSHRGARDEGSSSFLST
ncbi:PREDICTED: zinc finger protein 524-like [Elephantulus edwardii]|uniref:zinc finger protein 524-like n=1 Tax=Elephantulus edwardii TaxID=28737 RepID=UPI0003F0BC6A|nr:PREDICTED: zinc finger protein 524-like [Elephantulus edwardii]